MRDMQKNHWTLKDSEIKQLLEDYNLKQEKYNRKEAIRKIIDFEDRLAKGEIILDGETGSYIDQLKKSQPKLMITTVIFHNTMENGMPYIFVGHNGKGYYIPKETEVDIPDYILNSCIKDAIEHRLLPETQMNGDIKWIKRKIQRFPYSIIRQSHEIGS